MHVKLWENFFSRNKLKGRLMKGTSKIFFYIYKVSLAINMENVSGCPSQIAWNSQPKKNLLLLLEAKNKILRIFKALNFDLKELITVLKDVKYFNIYSIEFIRFLKSQVNYDS